MKKPTIKVVAALIFDAQNRAIITQRPEGAHLAGLWEFPGGRIEKNETPEQALIREIKEEIGLNITVGQLYLQKTFEYDIKNIDIAFYMCQQADLNQQPKNIEVADWRFVELSALKDYEFPPADRSLIKKLEKLDYMLPGV